MGKPIYRRAAGLRTMMGRRLWKIRNRQQREEWIDTARDAIDKVLRGEWEKFRKEQGIELSHVRVSINPYGGEDLLESGIVERVLEVERLVFPYISHLTGPANLDDDDGGWLEVTIDDG